MERLNHHHLYIFWMFAQKGSFTRAAESLRIAQSAVTAQIRSLEEVLSLTLVDRSNKRRPLLTEEGKKVLEYADSIFESAQDLMNWAKSGELAKTQTLRIGALSGLSRNLQYEFLKNAIGNPNIRIEVTTGDQDRLVHLLSNHSLDIILSSHNVRSEGKNTFHSHVLASSRVVFVTQRVEGRRKSPLSECLRDHPLYIPGKTFEARPELDALLERMSNTKIAGEIDDIALLRIFALRSGAIVMVPEVGVKSELERGELILLGATGVSQRFYVITRQRRFPNALVEKLVADVRKNLPKN